MRWFAPVMVARLDGVPDAPTRYVENGARPDGGDVPLSRPTLGWDVVRNKLLDPRAYAQGAAANLMQRGCPPEGTGKESKEYRRRHRTDSAVQERRVPESDPAVRNPQVKEPPGPSRSHAGHRSQGLARPLPGFPGELRPGWAGCR
ncbi:hypothetical protein ACFU6I_24350 [Streptomyces sp. NPDC057486]|uniref:hypothetical protein n=1 Tax=Streptomyces sp. NPDC057486 TaxID=3346145 RepID=UPI0036847993